MKLSGAGQENTCSLLIFELIVSCIVVKSFNFENGFYYMSTHCIVTIVTFLFEVSVSMATVRVSKICHYNINFSALILVTQYRQEPGEEL